MNRLLLCAAGATLMIGGAGVSTVALATPPAGATTGAAAYVAAAGASDQYEIQSSQLVLQSTQNERIRAFAQMMITDHTKTTQDVMAAAAADGMQPPPPTMDPQHGRMVNELQAQTGTNRDALYIGQQRQAHKDALALHSGYAKSGDKPALRQVASAAVPIITQHIAEVQSLGQGK